MEQIWQGRYAGVGRQRWAMPTSLKPDDPRVGAYTRIDCFPLMPPPTHATYERHRFSDLRRDTQVSAPFLPDSKELPNASKPEYLVCCVGYTSDPVAGKPTLTTTLLRKP